MKLEKNSTFWEIEIGAWLDSGRFNSIRALIKLEVHFLLDLSKLVAPIH